jgi:hypothetical protein
VKQVGYRNLVFKAEARQQRAILLQRPCQKRAVIKSL